MLLRRISTRLRNRPSDTPSPTTPTAQLSSSTLSPSTASSSLPDLPSLSAENDNLDVDQSLNLGWLTSIALLGTSRKDKTERYRALSMFKKVTLDHGVHDVPISDFLRALGVYAAMIDRSAKRELKQHARDEKADPTLVLRKRPRSKPAEEMQRMFREEPADMEREGFTSAVPSSPLSFSSLSTQRASQQTSSPIPDSTADVRAEHVQLLYHMLRHAESIYGFPINMASAPGTTLTRVTDRGIICSRTGVSPADLKCATFDADAFLPGHYVAVDRQIRAVVVCVRGTANLVDFLTDFAATEDSLSVLRDQGKQDVLTGSGHSGVVRSARKLFLMIRKDTLEALRENPGFELMVTGHSLGAATASVLALIMRDDPEFPRALAFCFAPMPCLSRELAEQTAEFTVTLVNGPDIVPRLSVGQLMAYFATARYVADLSRKRKILLTLGLHQAVIDWKELDVHNEQFADKLQNTQQKNQLYIPGKVFQLVRKNEIHRRDAIKNKLFGKRQVEILAVPRTRFLAVRSRERGMFISHAPVTYRNGLVNVLKSMDAAPLKAMSGGKVFRNLIATPTTQTLQGDQDSESLANLLDRLGKHISMPQP